MYVIHFLPELRELKYASGQIRLVMEHSSGPHMEVASISIDVPPAFCFHL
jgi:hypothetical protein